MRFAFRISASLAFLMACLHCFSAHAQNKKKYNSLFWEISGNGLQKPSYLFGTMHISNKMVFHLSDSFFTAIKNSDIVALELNPEEWQNEMQRMEKNNDQYRTFYAKYYTDYLKENSFVDEDFIDNLKKMLRFVPQVNNQLLYRTDKRSEDYQEDTYLDLYIYQTGKRLGKKTTGVETFIGSSRLETEAKVDAAIEAEKNPQTRSRYDSYGNISQIMQDAYRKGDLDLLDSLEKVTSFSEGYTEKFLYKRNEIQANSMDSIMKHGSLFVGVGAAHLPGNRGVIEILRKKGYQLRPILMQDRDAIQRKQIDSLTAPVHFKKYYEKDSLFSVEVPGRMSENKGNNISLQYYGDMSNGAYYMLTRFRTNTILSGKSSKDILKIVDSMLYENIPGTIISKKEIVKNGFDGLDIINRTKTGDIQRHQLIVTSTELLIFKMGGKGNYVYGKESDIFFNSIAIKPQQQKTNWQNYVPEGGGFSIKMPVTPQAYYTPSANDKLPEWRYEAEEPLTKDKYIVYKKSIYSFDFIEADTFDLMLMQESLGSNKGWSVASAAKQTTLNGRTVRDITFKNEDGVYVKARALLFGPQYYLLMQSSRNKDMDAAPFFESFEYKPFRYETPTIYRDTIHNYEVKSNVKLTVDDDIASIYLYWRKADKMMRKIVNYNNELSDQTSTFADPTTGEVIIATTYKAPKYFFIKDSIKFINGYILNDSGLVLKSKTETIKNDGSYAWTMVWADTGSTRLIKEMVLLKGMYIATVKTMMDEKLPESSFIKDFYSSFKFYNVESKPSIFDVKQDLLFKDFYSKDSLTNERAKYALSIVYYDKNGYPEILKAIKSLNPKLKDYYDTKSRFINELGYIRDTAVVKKIVVDLKQIYLDAGDTSTFQNSALKALTRLNTPEATSVFKQLTLQDPPVFETDEEYFNLFSKYSDTLQLATALYPELLQLSSIDDYKNPVYNLLVELLDSNLVKPEILEPYLSSILFDAKVDFKKMKITKQNEENSDDKDAEISFNKIRTSKFDLNDYNVDYAVPVSVQSNRKNLNVNQTFKLLAPFYEKNSGVQSYFENILKIGSNSLKMDAAMVMLDHKIKVPDTIWNSLLANKRWSYMLLQSLNEKKRSDLIPAKYQTKEFIAKHSFLCSDEDIDSLVQLQVKTINYKNKPLSIYAYKYKLKDDADWTLGFNCITQQEGKLPEIDFRFFNKTGEKLEKSNIAAQTEQINKKLKELIITRYNSGANFYQSGYNYGRNQYGYSEYDDN